uniref:Uncharacterized protein n=1 Tax=Rhizophora mucronata TaxID=61149 RepID=A0A2P2IL07_RHIMU
MKWNRIAHHLPSLLQRDQWQSSIHLAFHNLKS